MALPVARARDALNAGLRRVPVWPLYAAAALPVLWWLWLGATGGLGVDPAKTLEHRLGETGLQLLIATLCVTPLRRWTGVNLLRFRRALGLLAFGYVALHLLAWLVLDMALLWQQIWGDVLKRPYITLGMAGFLAMLPLALTSTDAAIRRLGPLGWRRLHRLVYPAAILGAAHYLMLVKAWPAEPILYAAAVAGLVLLRLGGVFRRPPAAASPRRRA
jgi:sulfoxide reductase heme-binding subunit YedZ